MKKNMRNFWILLIVISVSGTALVAAAEATFGIVPVFITATVIVMLSGLWVIVMQAMRYHAAKKALQERKEEMELAAYETSMYLEQ